MDIIRAFELNDTNFTINIQGTIDKPLFQANQIGELLEIRNIRSAIADFEIDKHKVMLDVSTNGGNQSMTFLTHKGLFKLLGMSRKPIAKTFQEWVLDILEEIRLKGKYQLQEQNKTDVEFIKTQALISRHTLLCEAYNETKLVYIMMLDIDLEPDTFYIKIGSTKNIQKRLKKLTSTFGCVMIALEAYPTLNHDDFEGFLHKNPYVSKYLCTNKINNVYSREVYIVTHDILDKIRQICVETLPLFNTYKKDTGLEEISYKKAQLKLETQKLKVPEVEVKKLEVKEKQIELELRKLDLMQQKQRSKQEGEEKDEYEVRTGILIQSRKNTRSPKVQQYDPVSFKLIRTFDAVIDVMRYFEELCESDINYTSASGSALRVAAKKNTIYKGFRWHFIDRDVEDKEYQLEPTTIQRKTSNTKYIAMLDLDKSKILEVFSSVKEASKAKKLKSLAAISKAIRNGSMSRGNYWAYYEACDEDMKNEYLRTNKLPEKLQRIGTQIVQIDPITNKELKVYSSINKVQLKFQLQRERLRESLKDGTVYKGFKWRFANNDMYNVENVDSESDVDMDEEFDIESDADTDTYIHEQLIEILTSDRGESSTDNVETNDYTKVQIIQIYDPITFQLIETFDSFISALNYFNNTVISYYMVKQAAKNNNIYNNFRWLLPDTPEEHLLAPTKETHYYNAQQIAIMNDDWTNIIKVFNTQKEVADHLDISHKTVSHAVNNNSLVKKQYRIRLWSKVDDVLKEAYESTLQTDNSSCVDKVEDNQVVATRTINSDLIALMDKDETEIIKVFALQKDINIFLENKVSSSKISDALQKKSIILQKYKLIKWPTLPKELQDKYLENNTLPNREEVLSKSALGKQYQKISPETGEVIKTYSSAAQVAKTEKIWNDALAKYCKSGQLYKGFIWKQIEK